MSINYLAVVNPRNSMHFNISHSGNFCVIAFSREKPIGIDLELIDQSFDFEQVINHIFTDEELETWKLLSSSKKVQMFYRKWVTVEAFLKAQGTGWLAEEELIKQAKVIAPYHSSSRHTEKFFTTQPVLLDIEEGYACALCFLNPPFSIEIKNGNDYFLAMIMCFSPLDLMI